MNEIVLRASSAERWINCPGSIELCKDIPDPPPSKYAEEGTMAHEIAANRLVSLRDGVKDNPFPGLNPNKIIPKEMDDAVNYYVEEVVRISNNFEHEVLIEHTMGRGNIKGTADCIVINGKDKVVTVCDFKYGKYKAISAEDNWQLLTYMFLLYNSWELRPIPDGDSVLHPKYNFIGFERNLCIIQPRCLNGFKSNSYCCNPEDFGRKCKIIYGIEDILLREFYRPTKLKRHTGSWCQWCKGKTLCSEYKEANKKKFNDKVFKDPYTMSVEDLSIVLKEGNLWLKECKSVALEKAKNKIDIPDFELKETLSPRKWRNEEEAEEKLRGILGNRIYNYLKVKSPTEIEKYVDKEIVDNLVTREVTGESLKQVKDKQPDINDMFN